jgi:multicomponent Na+:H+ antiporter subunit A
MLVSVLSGVALALLAPWLFRLTGRATGLLLGLASFGLAGYYLSHASAVAAGQAFRESYPWLPLLGIDLALYMDGLSLVFSLIITLVGGLVFLYSSRYMEDYEHQGRFYAYLMLFLASMLGVVLAGDLIVLIVFWELTSISSFLLIGFENRRVEARQAALQSLVITSGAGLALLGGMVLLQMAGGTGNLADLLDRGALVRGSQWYVAIVILVLVGAGAKSAQWPLHVWLPAAMQAPSPVSAYLHSAAMVKAGIYMLARLSPVLGGTDLWYWSVGTIGLISLLVGAWGALGRTDLKQVLAYSTISVLGGLVMLIGLGGQAAIRAMVVYLLAHALYKSSLFLMAGMIDHQTGTRDIRRLYGLRRDLPVTAAIGLLAGLSLAGLPFTFGFSGKELLLEAGLHATRLSWLYTAGAVLASTSMVAVAVICAIGLFWGPPSRHLPHEPHAASLWMSVPALLLAGGGVVLGLWPTLVDTRLLASAAAAILRAPVPVKLHVWPVANLALLLSALAIVAGLVVYVSLPQVRRLQQLTRRLLPPPLADGYGTFISGLNGVAWLQTRVLQNGSLPSYITISCLAVILLAGYTLIDRGALTWSHGWPEVAPHIWVLMVVLTTAWIASLFVRQLLSIVVMLGAVGFVVAMVFALHGGMDLALTQFAAEMLGVLLFVLVLYRLPAQVDVAPGRSRLWDLAVASGMGVLVAAILLAVLADLAPSRVTPFYFANALPAAHGRNVVTVILVDFRALDTMGEITVLAVASLGVLALLRLRPRPHIHRGEFDLPVPRKPAWESAPSMILVTACYYLLPLLLLFSIFLMLRGFEEPGGGFVGGLVGAMAFVFYMIARNVRNARQALRASPRYLVGVGLMMAAGSGIAGLLDGRPFLSGLWYGAISHAGTPALLDLGVYVLVIGGVLTIFFHLAEVS